VLLDARTSGRRLDVPLTDDVPLSLDDAYAVQRSLTGLRLARGERIVGWKLGYTSLAMREQMGIDAPNLGPLTDAMLLDGSAADPVDGRLHGDAALTALIPASALQPRVEPEIALRLTRDLDPGCSVDDVLDACRGEVDGRPGGAFGCLEVVDSIWSGYRFRLADNTADGSSAGWVALGRPLPLDDLPGVAVQLFAAGEQVAEATGAAAGGHPASGVAWLAGEVERRYGRRLTAGDLVITGGLTAAYPLPPGGRIEARFTPRGRPSVTVAVALDGRPRPSV
jgi:2-keto-4-pentenoate hydratase